MHNRRKGDGQPYLKQGYLRLLAHKVGYGDPDGKCAQDTLEHNKSGPAAAVKISDKTKQEGYQQGVNGISPQIVCRRQDNFWVFGKGTGEDSPMEEGNVKQDQANPKRHGHTIGHPPFGPVHFPGTEILRHKGGHGLAEGRRHHQNKGT